MTLVPPSVKLVCAPCFRGEKKGEKFPQSFKVYTLLGMKWALIMNTLGKWAKENTAP